MPVIGLDLGATKLASAVIDDGGTILVRRHDELAGRGGAAVGSLILDAVQALLDAARNARQPIDAIGVAVPGIARQGHGDRLGSEHLRMGRLSTAAPDCRPVFRHSAGHRQRSCMLDTRRG